jgi:hypothetical protein
MDSLLMTSLEGDTLDRTAAELYVGGWLLGDAINRGADTPQALRKALEARISEGDAHDAWPAIPDSIARIEVMRIRNGRAERLSW